MTLIISFIISSQLSLDNLITNSLVLTGELPAHELEIYSTTAKF